MFHAIFISFLKLWRLCFSSLFLSVLGNCSDGQEEAFTWPKGGWSGFCEQNDGTGGLKLNRLRWQVMWRSTPEEMTPIFYSYKSENYENRVLPLYHQPAIWPNPRVLYCEYRSVFACALPLWWERQNDKSNTTQEQRRLMQITNRAHLERFPAAICFVFLHTANS